MKFKYLIPLTALLTLIGCFGTDSKGKSEKEELPDGFSKSCYWESHQSVQGECGKNDESCIENHYLEVGERAGLEYECSEDVTSSEVVSSSSEDGTSSEIVSSSSEVGTSSEDLLQPAGYLWQFTDMFETSSLSDDWIQSSPPPAIITQNSNANQGVSSMIIRDASGDGLASGVVYEFPSPTDSMVAVWMYYDEAAGSSLDYDYFDLNMSDATRIHLEGRDIGYGDRDKYRLFVGSELVILGTRSVGWHKIEMKLMNDSIHVSLDSYTVSRPLVAKATAINFHSHTVRSCTGNCGTTVDSLVITAFN